MKPVGAMLEGVKPLHDMVSLAVVKLTAQSQSREIGLIDRSMYKI
jgi:hypothetical protein